MASDATFLPHRLRHRKAPRGITLIELTISMIVIGIMAVVAFSVFTFFQIQMIKMEVREQMQMIADNEMERLMSLPYIDLTVQAVADTWVLPVESREFEVSVQILELPNVLANPRWKEINVTVRFYGGQANPQEEISLRVFRSPATGTL